jgi:LPXTG-motif cell wall-anchored protein
MNVIEFSSVSDAQALNGWLKNTGCGFFKSSSTCSKVEIKKANDTIDVIKSEEGLNDLMYMKPEQAARTLNKILERLSYHQAYETVRAGSSKGKDSIKGHQDASKIFGQAVGEVMSQFRQYALGMDGEVQKLGINKKKINGFEFTAPFYKLILPQKAKGTNPVDGVSKDELLSILQNQKTALPVTGTSAKNNTVLFVGLGIGALALTGGIIYAIKNKK